MKHSTIYIGNDSVLIVQGLRDRAGTLIDSATVTLEQFVDKDDVDVSGVSTPATLSSVGMGNYELALPDDIGVVVGNIYRAKISALNGGLRGEWTETMIAKVRAA